MEPKEENMFASSSSITSSKSLPNPVNKKPEDDGVSFNSYGGNLGSIPASVRSSQYFSSGTYISCVCPPETSWVPENFSEFLQSAFTDGSLEIPKWQDSDDDDNDDNDGGEDVGDDANQTIENGDVKEEGNHLSVEYDKDRPLFTSWHAISSENRFMIIPLKGESGDDVRISPSEGVVHLPDHLKKESTQDDSEYDSVQSSSSTGGLLASAARKIVSDDSAYDSIQSSSSTRGLLASAAQKFVLKKKSSKPIVRPNNEAKYHMRKTLKNLAVLCIGFTMSFSAFITLRNLQSSLSSDTTLAMLSLAIIYFTFVVACVFSSTIVERFGYKYCIMAGQMAVAIYTACNFFPVSYVIYPASLVLGFFLPHLWIAHSLYLTGLATSYTTWSGKSKSNAITRFNGLFFMVWHIFGIISNLGSSFILYSGNTDVSLDISQINLTTVIVFDSNASSHHYLSYSTAEGLNVIENTTSINAKSHQSLCGAKFCHHYDIQEESSPETDPVTVKIFLGVFLAICLAGVAIIGAFLDNAIVKRSEGTLAAKEQIIGIFKHLKDRRALLLVVMVFYLGVQQVFVFSEITKAFVSCPYGIYKIGFLMISYGFCDAISSLLSGQMQKHVGRVKLFITAAFLNVAVLITMLLWQPTTEQEWVVYMLAAMWGLSDGIWITMTNSMVGILFIDNMKYAYASTRQIHAVGFAVAFAYSQYLCMSVKIYLTMGILLVSLLGYGILEYKLDQESQVSLKGIETNV